MYDNIGKKIKALAKASFIVEAIATVIVGLVLLTESEEPIFLLVLFFGPVVAWVSSWLLYGFGELIDKVCDIERNLHGSKGMANKPTVSANEERLKKLESMYAAGLITEEEYKQAISK